MQRKDIRRHMQPYLIRSRTTTINNAFASAVALNDDYDDQRVAQALGDLGQNPDASLVCFYCDDWPAETWDHVQSVVKAGKYSGYGHTLGNLVPCCKQCNSRKTNKDWRTYLASLSSDDERHHIKLERLQSHIDMYCEPDLDDAAIQRICPDETRQLDEIRLDIPRLMRVADDVAASIREKVEHARQIMP